MSPYQPARQHYRLRFGAVLVVLFGSTIGAVQAAAQAPAAGLGLPIPAPTAQQTLCSPQVVGNRRIPKESVLARLFSRPGDLYDAAVV